MFNETIPVRARRNPSGLTWALVAVVYLAAIATFIALNMPSADTDGMGGAGFADTSLVDYGLRHPPQPSATSSGNVDSYVHDYGLRHPALAQATPIVIESHVNDYALRHAPEQPASSFSTSSDYALRHLED